MLRLLAVSLLALLAVSAPARADLAPKKASEIVHVFALGAACSFGAGTAAAVDTIISPAATTAPLVIPKGKVFVVRRVQAKTTNQTPGDTTLMSVWAGIGQDFAGYGTHVVEVGSHGSIDETFDFPLGLVVPAGGALCIYNDAGLPMGGEAEGFLAPAK